METLKEKLTKKKNKIKKLQQDINYCYNFINTSKKEIKELEKFIWKNCDHKWIYLNDGNYYSKIKYKCQYCNLYRNEYMYI